MPDLEFHEPASYQPALIDLDAEITQKLTKGYPQDNIIFEDSREAILIQNRGESCVRKLSAQRRSEIAKTAARVRWRPKE
jgi:hypothetical protein